MYRFSFVSFVVFIILTTSFYTEAKGKGGSHGHSYPPSHGHSGGSHGSASGRTPSRVSHGYSTSHVVSGNSPSSSYHYKPPQHITYTPHGGAPMTYPVFVGTPPKYVYEYRDSGSVYGTLLSGFALYNLANSHGHHHNYNPQSGELCKFGVKKSNGDYEETKIKCDIMSSFILEEENKVQNTSSSNTTIVTTTWSNVTTFEMTNGQPNSSSTATSVNVTYTLAPNGTLIPVVTSQNITNDNGTVTSLRDSVTTTTTTNTTVTNALDVKGKEILVTPEMQCYMIRNTAASHIRKSVPCGVLQAYAEQSLHKNFAARHVPIITLFAAALAVLAIY